MESAGPSGFAPQPQSFMDQHQQPSTSAYLPITAPVVSDLTAPVQWHPSPRTISHINENVRSYIYNRTDPHIQLDMRAFMNLMEREEFLQPSYHYFTAVQEHLQPYHREQAIEWIYDVAKEENCDGDVFLLAVAIIDRFLSVQNVLKHDIQMIAGVALFIASKLKAPHPLTAAKIAYYSDNSLRKELILEWELLIVTALGWETESPTAFNFFDHLAARIPAIHTMRNDFQTVVHKCQRMHKLATLFPSMQCAIALYFCSRLPNQSAELAFAIRNLLASMFQLQVDLLDNYIPMVQRCLAAAPLYTLEEPRPVAVAPEPVAEEEVQVQEESYEEIEEEVEEVIIEGMTTPPPEAEHFVCAAPLFAEIPDSEQNPLTPLNDSGFCSEGSSPSVSAEKKRRRSHCDDDYEDDITPPKVFKAAMMC